MAKFFKLHLTLILLFLIAGTQSIRAHWVPDGVGICTDTYDQVVPQLVSDGIGGAIIIWQDGWSGTAHAIYAQRVDARGHALWTANGVALCTNMENLCFPRIVSDGEGGALVTWYDRWGIYAQRVDSSGNTLWGGNGVKIGDVFQYSPQLISDGAGGAIIAWNGNSSNGSEIYAQRINANGNRLWKADICMAAGSQEDAQLISDGAGGAIITWVDNRRPWDSSWDIYAQRVDASGNAFWALNGVAICAAENEQNSPQLASDGAGGAIIIWQDNRSSWDIYAQRVDVNGNALWTANGVAICTAFGQASSQLVSDGGGGAIITWQDFRSGEYNVYAQRVSASGDTLWALNGMAICMVAGDQRSAQLAPDAAGGVIITWEDYRSGEDYDVFAQRVDANGDALWVMNGVPICTATGSQEGAQLVSDGAGGAIITWEDYRSGSNLDIYAQRVSADGNAPIATLLQTYAAAFSGAGISLTWSLSEIDEDVKFSIQRSTTSNGPFTELPSNGLIRDGLSFSFIDRNWAPNASYWYRVEYSTGSERKILFESGPVTTPAMPLRLYQNSPNPFNPSTEIRYYLPEKCSVSLAVYDVTGVLVAQLSEGYRDKGSHTVSWAGRDRNGRQMSSGVYFYRLKAGKTEISKKMVLAR